MRYCLILLCLLFAAALHAQETILRPRVTNRPPTNNNPGGIDNNNAGRNGAGRKDSIPFEHRDDSKDSISVIYKFLDGNVKRIMDSSINDFDVYYPVPAHYQNLGNNGAAAFPLIYEPYTKPGWDAGFHAWDVYKFELEDTKFYKTRRPFSTFGYELAGGQEQMIQAAHTQNPRPNINFGLDYRLISAPGFFKTQNNTVNGTRFFGLYAGPKKRYNGTFVFLANNVKASQNGGIRNDSLLLDPDRKQRFSIPVFLGDSAKLAPDPFNTSISTGNIYKELTVFLRQSYDLGKRDSLQINDSTMEYLFYPKLRLQHTFKFSADSYAYNDTRADSLTYANWYNLTTATRNNDTIFLRDKFNVISNDFSLIQFPDTKNAAQYLLAGITLENIKRSSTSGSNNFFNAFVHGEYKNLTRNKIWNINAEASFYLAGINIGDYLAKASISRYLNRKLGNVELYFINSNRRPSFIFDDRSAYNIGNSLNLKKENIVSFGGTSKNSLFNLKVSNHFISNYAYYKNFYEKNQYSKPINILQIGADKMIKLAKHINWYPEATVQLTDAASPIKLPLIYTRNRIAFEGNFFKNLFLSTGLEVRYYTPYKASNFSPLNGQFVPQDSTTIKNLPDVNAFLHFRIKGFSLFFRAENLNTVSVANGFGFLNNNFAAPHYPTPGLQLRFAIRWWFIN